MSRAMEEMERRDRDALTDALAVRARYDRLTEWIEAELLPYLADRADAEYFTDSAPRPNEEMRLLIDVSNILGRPS